MEEDIKVLEEFVNQYNTDEDLFCFINYSTIQAIENLIKGYKDLVEKDKEHKKRITYLQNKITNQKEVLKNGVNVVNLNANRMCEVFELMPKSKIRDLKEQYKNKLHIQDNTTYTFEEVVETWINICEELLQEGDK